MPNLVIPLRHIQIVYLGGQEGELCLVNLITEFRNPSHGPNAAETIEFSVLLPRLGTLAAIKNLCMVHAHGTVVEIKESMLDQSGFEIPMPDVAPEKVDD